MNDRAVIDKSPARVQGMFARIAHRYDAANRVLSFGRDVAWRALVAGSLLPAPGVVLDLAAGTGDMTAELAFRGRHRVVSADFTFEMLAAGRRKVAQAKPLPTQVTADALGLPFRPGSFDAVTVAFGVRNFADPLAGLREMTRVVRPGGTVGVLEFSHPGQPLRMLYSLYSRIVIPAIGGLMTGERSAYEYLPRSVAAFPVGTAFLDLMAQAGLTQLTAQRLTGGIVTFYRGVRP